MEVLRGRALKGEVFRSWEGGVPLKGTMGCFILIPAHCKPSSSLPHSAKARGPVNQRQPSQTV